MEKHIAKPGLKVLIYNGVHSDGFIQPFTFNDYDVVITSYTNLSKDLNYFGSVVSIVFSCSYNNTIASLEMYLYIDYMTLYYTSAIFHF